MHKVIPSRFILAQNTQELPSSYIIELLPPFYIGKVFTYRDQDEDEYLHQLANSLWPVVTVPGYRILIRFEGTMANERRIEVDAETHGLISNVLKNMAQFYFEEKIERHYGYYKKFLIKSNMPEALKHFGKVE